MASLNLRGVLVADFTIGPLAQAFEAGDHGWSLELHSTSGMNVIAPLLDGSSDLWSAKADFCVVWARPEAMSAAFAARVEHRPAEVEAAIADVDVFCDAVLACRDRGTAVVFVPTFSYPSRIRGHGPLDMTSDRGVGGMLLQMNAHLAARLAGVAGVYVFDTQRWMSGAEPANPTMWYAAKVPYAPAVFQRAATDMLATLRASRGLAKKLLVLDLDNTLWGGVVGEVGWEKLRLGGHDPIGEAYVDFQRALKALTRRGVVLAVASKNDEARALAAIKSHPEMVLSQDDIAAWRINWQDKAANIAELASELNLGLDAVVFIDDNPVERARVRDALPKVLVPEWPVDVTRYADALADLRCFDSVTSSREDSERTRMYVAERERNRVRESVGSVDEWLHSLGTEVTVRLLDEDSFERTLQLINKTNQMNLRTRRVDADELRRWLGAEQRWMWTFRVADKFGDSGLVGVASLERDGDGGRVADFLLSCRVFNRHVEDAMLGVITAHAARVGLAGVAAEYVATEKNSVTLDFLKRSGLTAASPTRFLWQPPQPFTIPPSLKLLGQP
ncbi:MAG: HAD-IIIC family phosphatase [Myxococcota bacterium]|nr:HAD-IIIC family phosphatase [Myxococcota bacterium]